MKNNASTNKFEKCNGHTCKSATFSRVQRRYRFFKTLTFIGRRLLFLRRREELLPGRLRVIRRGGHSVFPSWKDQKIVKSPGNELRLRALNRACRLRAPIWDGLSLSGRPLSCNYSVRVGNCAFFRWKFCWSGVKEAEKKRIDTPSR